MQLNLDIGELYTIRDGLIREERYWRSTKRKDIRPSEQAMSIVSCTILRQKIESQIAEWQKREDARK